MRQVPKHDSRHDTDGERTRETDERESENVGGVSCEERQRSDNRGRKQRATKTKASCEGRRRERRNERGLRAAAKEAEGGKLEARRERRSERGLRAAGTEDESAENRGENGISSLTI